jgi:hypothetical protein|tara:strand:- start:1004 stop:1216 length:213 start_codon:yes stop_codon:yes gene_type:complete
MSRKLKHRIAIQDYATQRKEKKKVKGFSDLKSEIKSRLGMNQASNIWRDIENTKRPTVYRTGGIYNGYKY